MRELFGLEANAEVTLETLTAAYQGDSTDTLVRGIELAEGRGAPFTLVSEIRTPSRQRRWIRTLGQPVGGGDAGRARVVGTI